MRFFFLIGCLFIALTSSLSAASWSILPVYSERLYRPYDGGPRLFTDTETNNWELAQLIRTWLLISGEDSVLSQDTLRKAYQRLALSSKKYLNENDLKKIARELDSEKLLVSQISKNGRDYMFLSRIYYKSSSFLTDTIQSKGRDLWKLFQKHLEARFSFMASLKPISSSRSGNNILFLLDLSGANYYPLRSLSSLARNLNSSDIGICGVDASGNVSSLRLGHTNHQVIRFLNSLRPKGGGRHLKKFYRGLECLERIHSQKKAKSILLVSSIPGSTPDQRRVKLLLRRLSRKSDILIIGTAALRLSDRIFWKDTVSELGSSKRHTYQDLIYRQKLGLSNGDEIYLFWEGDKIFEGGPQEDFRSAQFQWRIPKGYWPELGPGGMSRIYQRLSQNRVIVFDKPKILLEETMLEYISNEPKERHNTYETESILISISKSNFWVNLPKSALYEQNGSPKLSLGESYYFMLDMKPDERGVPFKNASHFGYVFKDYLHVPGILHVNIFQYLANRSKFLYKSIGGSSVYIFFAEVKRIQK